MRFYWVVLAVTVVLISLGETKKQKSAKTIPANPNPQSSSPKQQTQYDQCKIQCKTQREFIGKREYVEQLRRELEAAEHLLESQKEHLPEEFQENQNYTSQNGENARKISRYDHLKAAASKIVESGSELKQAVTGDNSN